LAAAAAKFFSAVSNFFKPAGTLSAVPETLERDYKMKNGMVASRQDELFARNAAFQTGHVVTKPNRIHRIQEESAHRSIRPNRQSGHWHKQIGALLVSVERAWAAAERMRVAIEEHGPETCEPEEDPLNDVF
jgi:hypothetical protein